MELILRWRLTIVTKTGSCSTLEYGKSLPKVGGRTLFGGTTMVEYLLLIHGNAKTKPAPREWDQFIAAAQESDFFAGGSAVGQRVVIGDTQAAKPSEHIVGYMRFDADNKQKLLDLLKQHPVVIHGGSVELCEMSKS